MNGDTILICNAGSSSLKVELYRHDAGAPQALRPVARASAEGIGAAQALLRLGSGGSEPLGRLESHEPAVDVVLDRLAEIEPDACAAIVATGHRVVHGGSRFAAPVRVTPLVYSELAALTPLAPLHNPPALAVMKAVDRRLDRLPMVAAFDTAFFRGLPEHVRRYAVPAAWTQAHGIERFGFHGLAHESMYRSLAAYCGERIPGRVVTLQLGNGCSAAALSGGEPVETSMGFTPLEGLVMATRSGDLDPGVLPYLVRLGYDWSELEEALSRESGLRALSQQSGDMRELCALEAKGHRGAALAIAAFCHRVTKYVGAYAAVLGGLDALVFGGGIGENAAALRARVCAGFAWLGLELDAEANARALGVDAEISVPGSSIRTYVLAVDEEVLVAEAVVACLSGDSAASATGTVRVLTNQER